MFAEFSNIFSTSRGKIETVGLFGMVRFPVGGKKIQISSNWSKPQEKRDERPVFKEQQTTSMEEEMRSGREMKCLAQVKSLSPFLEKVDIQNTLKRTRVGMMVGWLVGLTG